MEGKVEIMKKRCAAFFLFVILILGTVVPVCAEAVQEYPETESGSITSDQELYSEQGYTEEDTDLVFTEKESDPELTEEDSSLEMTEDESGLELTKDETSPEYVKEDSGQIVTEDESGLELSEEDSGLEYEEISEPSVSAAADGTYGDDSEIVDDWANCYYRSIVAVDVRDGVITGIDGQGDTDDDWSIDCFQAALNAMKKRLVGKPVSAAQSLQTDVDAVSEATYSSNALILEIQKALNSDPKGPYTLEWKNGEQSLQLLENVKYGTATPDYSGETPVRQADAGGTYVFTGWDPAKEIWVTQDVTYTAEFEKTTAAYSITYDLDGGTLPSGENPQEYTADTDTFTLINPVKEDYAFAGWTGTGITGKAMEVTIARGSTGDRSYTATWKKAAQGPDVQDGVYIDGTGEVAGYYYHPYVRITVEDGRISSVDVTAQDVGSNTSFLNTAVTWLRNGLVGEYASGTSVDAIDAVSGATFTKDALRAAAKKALDPEDSWLISWENYDGSLLDRAFVTTGTVPVYEGEEPEREDHFFIGWTPEITAAAADTAYTADFRSANTEYTVTYDLNGGNVDPPYSYIDQSGYKAGDSVTVLSGSDPILEGFKFLGWKYGDRILTAGDTFTMPPSAVTLTAVWKEWHGEGIYGDDSAADPLGYLEKIYVSVEVNDNNEILSVAADAVAADTAASQEDLEILEFGKALEWVNNQLLYFDIVSGGADSLEMYYYMAEGSDFLYAQPIIGGVMTALQQDPKPLITVNVKDEQDNLLSTISGIRYGTRFTAAVPEAPVKPEDASNTYAFTGWDETTVPAILTADAEVTACYMAAAKDPKDITAAVISDIAPVSYTGSPITPAFTVTEAGENGRVLTKGKNFKVSYTDNTDAGTASVTVTGIGAYSGKQTKSFQILPRQVTPVVTLEKDAYVYDGAGKRPSVIVTVDPPAIASSDNGSGENGSTKPWGDAIELPAIPVNGRASSQAVGSFLSDDTAVNAQTETRTAEQEDTQAGVQTELQTDAEAVSADREFAGQDQDSSAPILLKEGDDYDVSYPDGCIRAGTYTVTVTLKGNYTGTGEAQFTISPRDLTPEITLTRYSCTYTGKIRKPGVSVTFDGKELIENTDYTVKYENNINAGTAAVVVTGKGDFTGTVRESFEIVPRKIKPDVTLSKNSFTYNGKSQKPAVTVKDHGTKLASSNYTVTYLSGDKASDCKNAGTYKVAVKLKDNYSGSNTVSYKISARKITPAVTLAKTVYTWNGKAQKPAVTVKDGKTKLASSNYTVTYASGCKNVGTYKVNVKLKGNYSGSKAVSFRIDPRGTTLTGLSAASGAFTASWKKQTAQTTGYQIQYSTSASFKSGNKTVTVKGASAVSKKIVKLGAGKTYYVRIRTYRTVGEKNYYSAWSAKKSVKTKK